MTITKQRTLDYVTREWGTYVERFKRLPQDEQAKRIQQMGFERFRDMLAHILEWWDEGMSIIRAVAEDRPFERKKYDFDTFNADAVVKYKDWDETAFLSRFEETRQKMEADLKSVDETMYDNRRIQSWIQGILIHHAREHLVALSRFLALDVLENEWAEYINGFKQLDADRQKEFLVKQGFRTFHDLLAHVIGWWEEGTRIISGILETPGFSWTEHDVDKFNAQLKKKYANWSDEDLFKHFENVRRAIVDLVTDLPEDAFLNRDIEGWLIADVVEHYDEHPIPS